MPGTSKRFFLLACAGLFTLLGANALAQVRSGAAFLNTLPTARLQALAGGVTSTLDDPYALYANPGAAGFLREWQWSASYTRWIADVYNASLLYGRRLRLPWSSSGRVAAALYYQGMPEFDSSDHAAPAATASDLVLGLTWGQRLSSISDNVSVGASAKYLRSSLAQYTASTLAADAGFVVRSDLFDLGLPLLDYGILSAGASISNLGHPLTFEQQATPLPRALRVGASFYAGTHDGLQLHFLADYRKARDLNGDFALGAEISWSRLFAVALGYDFANDLMDRVSLGASIRLDDVSGPGTRILSSRGDAVQFDLASLGEGEFFSRTYRGTVTYYPLGPESFALSAPVRGDTVRSAKVVLRWENTRDPDLYDQLSLWVLLDQDPDSVRELAELAQADPGQFESLLREGTPLRFTAQTTADTCVVPGLTSGVYYWTVVALDLDKHAHIGGLWGRHVEEFFVPYSDIRIKNLQFKYSPWITEDDYQGTLRLELSNDGDLVERNFNVSLIDSVVPPHWTLQGSRTEESSPVVLLDSTVSALAPGQTLVFELPWHTRDLGEHVLTAAADARQVLSEDDLTNNLLQKHFFTIPKGKVSAADTAVIFRVSQVAIDMPIITEVCFAANRTEVQPQYLHRSVIDPPLRVLSSRLKQFPYLKITLQGFADPNSGEIDTTLANRRAEAVRDSLVALGVEEKQIQILPGKLLPVRLLPANKQDAKWILQERRCVKITANHAGQMALFQPVHHVDSEKLPTPVPFNLQIRCAAPSVRTLLVCRADATRDSLLARALTGRHLVGKVQWHVPEPDSLWLDQQAAYEVRVVDKLGRRFRSHPQHVRLTQDVFTREYRIAFPMKFAQPNPLYGFYWTRVFEQIKKMLKQPDGRMRFAGFACAIGPEKINLRLSERRARRFHEDFLKLLDENYPDLAAKVRERLDPPKGYGEAVPLQVVHLDGRRVLIGDNNKPMGRKLNRRIEVIFYRTGKPSWSQAQPGGGSPQP